MWNTNKSKITLRLAALYNIVWGLLVIAAPNLFFDLIGIDRPNYPEFWQCIGMIVGVYGVGYWLASYAPLIQWPIVLVGLLGKIFGPLGFAYALITGKFPIEFGIIIVFNDLIWLIPFLLILRAAYLNYIEERLPFLSLEEALVQFKTNKGEILKNISEPYLLIFLRHAGCTFCREALDDLKDFPKRVIYVTMSKNHKLPEFVYDPERKLYQSFGLKRGTIKQLFGFPVFLRGLPALLRYGVGDLDGDGFQMPGAFLILNGKVIKEFRHQYASDRPDYQSFCSIPSE